MCYNTRNIYDIRENCNSKENNCNSKENNCNDFKEDNSNDFKEGSTNSIDIKNDNVKNDNIKEGSTDSIDSTFYIKKEECNISSSKKNTTSTENVPLKNTSTKTSFENYPSSTKKHSNYSRK
ncbi:hypothetical protein NAPIS_ORF02646 [Vairimorpha apis BRL 01]|uniref:Uncharacterized protein n=1 Tax=Vairimorpha apis BRL 01 TaxID=1037528 RepID=T0L4Z7_9MICR|nr:hypothetical protein NAPIS_ORF02646 [Vairimorpha apis BRL 01]